MHASYVARTKDVVYEICQLPSSPPGHVCQEEGRSTGALDRRRGRGEHPSIPVSPKGRTRLHPLGQSWPEFIARVIRRWLETSGVRTLYIEPGSFWEYAYSAKLIRRFSDYMLDSGASLGANPHSRR